MSPAPGIVRAGLVPSHTGRRLWSTRGKGNADRRPAAQHGGAAKVGATREAAEAVEPRTMGRLRSKGRNPTVTARLPG